MALDQGAKLVLFIDGDKIATLTDVEISNSSGKIKLENLEKGFSGFSIGAGVCTITGKCNLLLEGQEFDFVSEASQEGGYHEVQVPIGAKSYIGEGYFDEGKAGSSTGSASEVSFTFIGESNKLE